MEWGRVGGEGEREGVGGRREGERRMSVRGVTRTGGEGGRVGERGGAGRLSLNLQLAAAVQTGFMVIALAAGHNPQHQGFS